MLLDGKVLHVANAVLALELEQIVQERDEERLPLLRAEDPLEHEIGLGVREDRDHEDLLHPLHTGGNGDRAPP